MKAAFLTEIKKPLVIREYDPPQPTGNEVLIRQSLTGICFRDVLTRDGFMPRVKLPIIPGHEISGRIVAVGPDVKGFNINERVASLIYTPCGKCEFCLRGDENLCPNKITFGEGVNGGYTRDVIANENSLVHVPDDVADADASLAACVTGMLYNALVRVGKLQAGERVLISGAGGGVGVHAVELAKALGAFVVAETSSKWKEEILYKMGADIVVSGEGFDRTVKEKTGDGVHLALEGVGLPTFDRSLRSLRTGGRMVVIGNVDPSPVPLPLGIIILKGNSIHGSISSTREDMRKVLEMTSQGKIRAVIHEKIALEDVNKAYGEMKEKKSVGRIMIDLSR